MEDDFFDEQRARELGEQEILILGISEFNEEAEDRKISLTLSLPDPSEPAYTNTKPGRVELESGDKRGLRGMAGGIAYTWDGSLIVQSKFYPKSGDRFFSPFSGLSSSLVDIEDPRRIIVREGLEEMVAIDESSGLFFVPNLADDKDFEGTYSPEEIRSIATEAATGVVEDISRYKLQNIPFGVRGNKDSLTILDSSGRILLDNYPCLTKINRRSNSFDVVKIVDLRDLPPSVHFYEAEFGNDVVTIPLEQLSEMWKNWGDLVTLRTYTRSGESRDVSYKGLFDSLLQTVGQGLNLIDGKLRFDYRDYGKKSIYNE